MNHLISALLFSLLSLHAIAQGIILEPGIASTVKISSERLKRIDQLIQGQIDSGLIKGAVGFVARDGKIIYYKAFGMDDADKKTPLKKDAIFRIASQTKAITSVAVMMLFEEGRFLLDDSIAKYIPAFTNQQVIDQFYIKDTSYTTKLAKRAVTIRDLLTHTSGIDYTLIGTDTMMAIYAKAGIPFGCEIEPVLLSNSMNKLGKLPLRHQPGERFTYGLNVDVLGYLIEVLSKMSLDQFLQQRLFKPLGMVDTYFYLPPSKYPRLVNIYTNDEKHELRKFTKNDWQNMDYPMVKGTYFSGGVGLSSTIMDYAIFLQMMLNGGQYNGQRILSKHTVDLMTSNQIAEIPWSDPQFSLDRWGLGFAITTKAGQSRLGQTEGSFEWCGIYNTYYWVDPKERLVGLLYTQQLPFSWTLQDKYKVAVYQALGD